MSSLLKWLWILTFFSSLAMGEELCCQEEMALETATSQITSARQSQFELHRTHADAEKTPCGTHFCLGCSHSPLNFTQTSPLLVVSLSEENFLATSFVYWPSPFLEGPFQPPRV